MQQVCELDIIFNFEKAYFMLDELLLGGEVQESSKKNVLKAIAAQDLLQEVLVCMCSYVSRTFDITSSFVTVAEIPPPPHGSLLAVDKCITDAKIFKLCNSHHYIIIVKHSDLFRPGILRAT